MPLATSSTSVDLSLCPSQSAPPMTYMHLNTIAFARAYAEHERAPHEPPKKTLLKRREPRAQATPSRRERESDAPPKSPTRPQLRHYVHSGPSARAARVSSRHPDGGAALRRLCSRPARAMCSPGVGLGAWVRGRAQKQGGEGAGR